MEGPNQTNTGSIIAKKKKKKSPSDSSSSSISKRKAMNEDLHNFGMNNNFVDVTAIASPIDNDSRNEVIEVTHGYAEPFDDKKSNSTSHLGSKKIHPLAIEEAFNDDEDMIANSPHPQHKTAETKRKVQFSKHNYVVSKAVTVNQLWVHGSLFFVQAIFGIGSVVGALGLPSFHPLTFALVRESSATVLLLIVAHILSRHRGGLLSGSLVDAPKMMVSGLGVFCSQAFYIIGVKLTGSVAASVWQPAAPIVTASLCIILGWEPFRCIRVGGILFAFCGCAYMVIAGNTTTSHEEGGTSSSKGEFSKIAGHFSFFFNTIGVSLYVMSSKSILATDRYEPIAITAWAYVIATTFMAIFSFLFSLSPTISQFLCSDCDLDHIWHVPQSAIKALVFFIIFTSALAYTLIMFANKHASSTLVTGYSVLQPVITDVLIVILIKTGSFPSCFAATTTIEHFTTACLEFPDKHAVIGAIAVIVGLVIMISTEPPKQQYKQRQDNYEEDEKLSLLEMAENLDNNNNSGPSSLCTKTMSKSLKDISSPIEKSSGSSVSEKESNLKHD